MKTTIKLQDTAPAIGAKSRLESYWLSRGFEDFYSQFRGGIRLPREYHDSNSIEEIVKAFNLHAVGFGNWVTQEDRFNYLQAIKISLFDLGRILKFPKNNIGIGSLSISFGARGQGKALAHYEPGTSIINITRYHDLPGVEKKRLWAFTGGAGSFAHEYGHFLDYKFAAVSGAKYQALSGGRSAMKVVTNDINPGKLPELMNDLINSVNVRNGQDTAYRKRIASIEGVGNYFIRRNEIFARLFEQYIFFKLEKAGVKNHFLHDTKYSPTAYLTRSEMQNVIPKMDAVISAMRALL